MILNRELPTLLNTDVAVVGGGPAGMCAAISAARAGAETAIIERWPVLGGQSTMARVTMWHTSDREREVILGLTRELVERLQAYDGIQRLPDFPHRHETYLFNAESLLMVYDDLVQELGIRALCHTPCVDALVSGRRIEAIVVGTKRGLQAVRAPVFIDASGDGDLGFFAGCRTFVGRECDGKVQGMTLVCSFKRLDQSQQREIEAAEKTVRERMKRLRDEGALPSFGPHWFGGNFVWRWPASLILCTSGDPLDAEDLTRATTEARGKIPEFLKFFRQNFPGCQDLQLDWTARWLGIRESRRIRGLYIFKGADAVQRRRFPDAVGHGFWMVDVHSPDGSGHTSWYDQSRHPEPGTTYQIPYRILVSADMDNLLMAGRCASATHEGMAALRVQSHCHIMGQAAGTAATLALESRTAPVGISTRDLQKRLINAGVWIDGQPSPQEEES